MQTCYFNFIQLIEQMRTFSIVVSTRSVWKLCTIPNYGNGVLSGSEYALVFTRTRLGARLTASPCRVVYV